MCACVTNTGQCRYSIVIRLQDEQTSTDAPMAVVQRQLAVESSVFVTAELVVAEIALLTRTYVATVAAVFDRVAGLAPWRVLLTAARIPTAGHPRHRRIQLAPSAFLAGDVFRCVV